jgi:hypothetical protein
MLPKQEIKYYDFEINGKQVEFRQWKTKDEKEFLILKENSEELSDEDIFKSLVIPCLKDPSQKLTEGEKQMVMLEIRKKSLGESLDIQFTCGKCSKYNEIKIKLSDIVKYKPFKLEQVTKNDISITFKDVIDVTKLFSDNLTSYNFSKFVMHVDTVTINNEVYKADSFEDTYEFFDNMDVELFDFFYEKLASQAETINYEAKSKCIFCQSEQDIGLGDIPNLFPW